MTRNRITPYRLRRILAPAYGLRRFLSLSLVGLLAFLAGIALSFKVIFGAMANQVTLVWNKFVGTIFGLRSVDQTNHILGLFLIIGGFVALYIGVNRAVLRLREGHSGGVKAGTMEAWRRKQTLAVGPRIVAIGGGTGLGTLLRGLKQHSANITAIVTVSDDGGSSGKLVQEMGIIPPGDMRNCLVSLADAEKLMTDLFQHRFSSRSGSLSGHSVGNLLIAGLIEQCEGDIDEALKMASEVLAIRGRVVPSTMNLVRLRALMDDGSEIWGETAIVASNRKIRRIYLDPENPKPHETALAAIREAELICIGPGSVYTSVIPNLLVPGIADAIAASEAPKAYICNVMTQRGESESFTAAEHMVAIQANVEAKVADYVVINTGMPSQATLDKYRESKQDFVFPDSERLVNMGYKPVKGDLMSELDYVRHDPAKLASKLMELL